MWRAGITQQECENLVRLQLRKKSSLELFRRLDTTFKDKGEGGERIGSRL